VKARGCAPKTKAEFMTILITVLHILVCIFLIAVVLLQSGKSADIAAAFGGMGSQTAFGTRTAATVLSKATTWAAVIFMLTSMTLTVFATRRGTSNGSVLSGTTTTSAPAKRAPAPVQKPAPEPQPVTPNR
jgi:preprotein translocase subunit SecG